MESDSFGLLAQRTKPTSAPLSSRRPPESKPRSPASFGELLRMINPRKKKPWSNLAKTTKQINDKLCAIDVSDITALRTILIGAYGDDLGITLNQRLEQKRKLVFNQETINLFVEALQIPQPKNNRRDAEEYSKAMPSADFELQLQKANIEATMPRIPVQERVDETWFSTFERLEWHEVQHTTDGFGLLFSYEEPPERNGAVIASSSGSTKGDCVSTANKKTIYSHSPRHTGYRPQFCTLKQFGLCAWDQKHNEYARYKEPHQEGNFQSLVFIDDLRVYFVSSMDMHLYVFSQELELVYRINSNQRVISQIEYDKETKILYTGGVDGLTAWRILFKKANSILGSVKGTYKLHMLHKFSKCAPWIAKMRLKHDDHHIYVLRDQSVEVFDTRDPDSVLEWSLMRRCNSETKSGSPASPNPRKNCGFGNENEPKRHETPITAALWYKRSQYWITSCLAGKIKVWTRYHSISSQETSSKPLESGKDWVMLHQFEAHTQGVTALEYIDTYGYIVSASLDATIRCWDVETLALVNVVHTSIGITNIQLFRPVRGPAEMSTTLNPHLLPYHCIVDHTNGGVGVWQINTHAVFFDSCQDEVQNMTIINTNSVNKAALKAASPTGANKAKNRLKENSLFSFLEGEKSVILVRSARDIRLYSAYIKNGPKLLCALEPGSLADALLNCEYSIRRKTIYGLMGNGDIYMTANKRSRYFEFIGKWKEAFPMPGDVSTCLVLLDIVPRLSRVGDAANLLHEHRDKAAARAAKATSNLQGFGRLRAAAMAAGEAVASAQVLALGGTKGFVSFLDAEDKGKLLASFNAHDNTPIHQIYYSSQTKILITLDVRATIKFWQLPAADLLFANFLGELPSAVAFSNIFPRMLIGFPEGVVCMLNLQPLQAKEAPQQNDHTLTLHPHAGSVICLSFCDNLRLYASSSIDRSVHIRDFGNRLVHRLVFTCPPHAMTFVDDKGTIILSQKNAVVKIDSELVLPPHMMIKIFKYERAATFIAKNVRGYIQRARFSVHRADRERERAEAEAQRILQKQKMEVGQMLVLNAGNPEHPEESGSFYNEDENAMGLMSMVSFDQTDRHIAVENIDSGISESLRRTSATGEALSIWSQDTTTQSPQYHKGGSIGSALTTSIVHKSIQNNEHFRTVKINDFTSEQFSALTKSNGQFQEQSRSRKSSYFDETVSQEPFDINQLSEASVACSEAPPSYTRRVRPTSDYNTTKDLGEECEEQSTVSGFGEADLKPVSSAVNDAFELAQLIANTCIREAILQIYHSEPEYIEAEYVVGNIETNERDDEVYSDISGSTNLDRGLDIRDVSETPDAYDSIQSENTTPPFDGVHLPNFIRHVSITSKDAKITSENHFPEPPSSQSQRPSFELSESETTKKLVSAYATLAREEAQKEKILAERHQEYASFARAEAQREQALDGRHNASIRARNLDVEEEGFDMSSTSEDLDDNVYNKLGSMVSDFQNSKHADYDPFNENFAGSNSGKTWRLSAPSSLMGYNPIPPAPYLASRFPRRKSRQRKIRSILYQGDARWEVRQTNPGDHLSNKNMKAVSNSQNLDVLEENHKDAV